MELDFENEPPSFSDTSQERSVPENTDSNNNIGTAVEAVDGDDNPDTLTYSLGGTESEAFNIISSSSGQISTRAELDYETKRSYRVTVTATDTSLRTASANVTINITNVDEDPEITPGMRL